MGITAENANQGKLTLKHQIIFGLAYMSPLAAMSTLGIVTEMTQGLVATTYLIALIVVMFTVYSYSQMVKAYPISGSSYTYTQKSLHPNVGFLVGWAVLMDYLFVPMLCTLIFGLYMNTLIPEIPQFVWMISLAVLMTILNVRGVKLAVKVNSLLILLQYVGVAVFVYLCIRGLTHGLGSNTLFSLEPFYNPNFALANVVAGAALVFQSFLGFDAIATLAEESVQPKKTIPKALAICCLLNGLVFVTISYLSSLAYPSHRFQSADTGILEIGLYLAGNWYIIFSSITSMIASAASMLASQSSAATMLYVMSRDGVFPKKWLARKHSKFGTPYINIILIGLISMTGALFLNLGTAASFINFGAFLAFTSVNLCVIAHYYIRNRQRSLKDHIFYLLIPSVGAVSNLWLLINLERTALILGTTWIILGIAYLLYLTRFFKAKIPQMEVVDQHVELMEKRPDTQVPLSAVN
ncbi:APC family permease [Paenibacillus barcinonensis]|uniref:APC family permease n=1 Tax=Paenibacillus barcinonensis TaxID=198119 RepID=A0A2V4W2R4_PAEBA|nr:APC family permease [Paenibacillus barcinonensis]PYE45425.1 amino acid transporter [Paenibacillus barcinonensis]QKS55241.1 APC family permease [Paenibacillus barcinonensis]